MLRVLKFLDGQTLYAIGAALRSGRLGAPFTTAALQRYCPNDGASALAEQMQRLAEEGIRPEHLALLLESVARERAAQHNVGDAVDLVWSGPEVTDVVSRDTGAVVRELFSSAHQSVLVAGFAVYQGQEIFHALAERMEAIPHLPVRMFLDVQRPYTDTSADSEILTRFARRFRTKEWPGSRLPQIFYNPRSLAMDPKQRSSMHAKCIIIDRQVALVTSANFTQAAQVRNIEVGLLIRSKSFAMHLTRHFESLADTQHLLPVPGL